MRGIVALSLCLFASPAIAGDLSGMWELQAIGQDGTSIQCENKDDVILFYRVMYPEFEGEKYKLEHLYKGRMIGNKISGTLLVRDDPKGNFENLRSFDGTVRDDKYVTLDDLPIKLIKAGKDPLPVQPPSSKKKKRGGTPTAMLLGH
jgi:hypothetical protein